MIRCLGLGVLAWGLGLGHSAMAQEGLVPGLQNMGIYGGRVERTIAAAVDGATTRLYASFANPNSVF